LYRLAGVLDALKIVKPETAGIVPASERNGAGNQDRAEPVRTLLEIRHLSLAKPDVMWLDDYVADIDANTESEALVFRVPDRKFMNAGLELHRSAYRFNRTRKLRQNPSPVFLTMRPPCSAIAGLTASIRSAVSLAWVASSSSCMSRE
jgi:hypothetical protein